MQAVTPGTLWGVDRETFRNVVVAFTAARRARFEGALAVMPIFSGLLAEQRAAIAVRSCWLLRPEDDAAHSCR